MNVNLNIIKRSSGVYTPLMPMEDNILYYNYINNYDIIAHYIYSALHTKKKEFMLKIVISMQIVFLRQSLHFKLTQSKRHIE